MLFRYAHTFKKTNKTNKQTKENLKNPQDEKRAAQQGLY